MDTEAEKSNFIDPSAPLQNHPPPYPGTDRGIQSFPQQPTFGYPQFPLGGQPMPEPNYNAGYPGQQPPQGTGGMSESIMAAQAVTAAISQNGRNPVTVVCPNCKVTGVTEITELENTTAAQGMSSIMYMFFGGTALVFVAFFIFVTFMSGTLIPLGVMPVFLIFLLVGFCVMRKASQTTAKMCTDIQHYCTHCKTLLGVSSGTVMMQQMQMRNRRFNRFNNSSF